MEKHPQFTGSRYVLAVKNLTASVSYYMDQLGFSSLWTDEGWHALQREAAIVMLGECPDAPPAAALGDHAYFAYIEVHGIDALYEEFQRKGVDIIRPVKTQPWGQREFPVRTVDGHRIMFGESV